MSAEDDYERAVREAPPCRYCGCTCHVCFDDDRQHADGEHRQSCPTREDET